jgi:hypothetical protein
MVVVGLHMSFSFGLTSGIIEPSEWERSLGIEVNGRSGDWKTKETVLANGLRGMLLYRGELPPPEALTAKCRYIPVTYTLGAKPNAAIAVAFSKSRNNFIFFPRRPIVARARPLQLGYPVVPSSPGEESKDVCGGGDSE